MLPFIVFHCFPYLFRLWPAFFTGIIYVCLGYLEDRHFFEYQLEKILKSVGNSPRKLVVILMLMSAIFAALVDEVTSILFMTATDTAS